MCKLFSLFHVTLFSSVMYTTYHEIIWWFTAWLRTRQSWVWRPLDIIKPKPWLFFQPSIEVINPFGPPQDDLRAWSSRTRRHTCPRGSRARTWSCWRRSSTRSRSRRSKARPQKAGSKSQRARGSGRLSAPEHNRIRSGKSFRRTGSWPARAQSVIWNTKLSNDFFAFSSIHYFNIRLPSISISKLKPSQRGFFSLPLLPVSLNSVTWCFTQ